MRSLNFGNGFSAVTRDFLAGSPTGEKHDG